MLQYSAYQFSVGHSYKGTYKVWHVAVYRVAAGSNRPYLLTQAEGPSQETAVGEAVRKVRQWRACRVRAVA